MVKMMKKEIKQKKLYKKYDLEKLYKFLIKNRKYNRKIQKEFYKECVCQYNSTNQKVRSLLYHIINTQPHLRMDKSCSFFKMISRKNLSTFRNFLKALGAKKKTKLTFQLLFESLKKQKGWGEKTSALFTKAIFNMHCGYLKEFKFWVDVPKLTKNDELFIPVDSVIKHIFKNYKANNFTGINKFIKEFNKKNIDVWDDLWFWGFITQSSKNNERKTRFNNSKYWNLRDTPKDQANLNKILSLSKEFIKLTS